MNIKKIIFATNIGTLFEWFEFTFFAYIAEQISGLFFSMEDPYIARLKMYAIFATSYFMRPFGAILFGNIGDKYGRKPAMVGALLLMSFATFGIGILPTYESIGAASSILLIILRMIQGIAVAGEFNGSAVLLTEHENKNKFLSGSWTACTAAGGMAIGSISATILHADSIPSWGWRVPFLLSSIVAIVGIYLRHGMPETKIFLQAKKENKLFSFPAKAAWKYNKKGLICTAGFSLFISVQVYTENIYYKIMAVNLGNIAPYYASMAITVGVLLTTILIPIFAHVSDKTNGYNMCIFGLILAIIFSPIIMLYPVSGNLFYVFLGQIMHAIINSMVSAPMFTLMLSKFQVGNKYSGSSIAWSITTAIFGGTALMVDEFLMMHFKQAYAPGIYISLTALICLSLLILVNRASQLYPQYHNP